MRDEYERAKAAVQEKTAELNRASKEIQSLETQRDALLKEANSASLEARKISHKDVCREKTGVVPPARFCFLTCDLQRLNSWFSTIQRFLERPRDVNWAPRGHNPTHATTNICHRVPQ